MINATPGGATSGVSIVFQDLALLGQYAACSIIFGWDSYTAMVKPEIYQLLGRSTYPWEMDCWISTLLI